MKKKRAFTLLEIMIVIFLIGLIGSIIGYNMKGSLDEGKAFKTKQAMIRLYDIFELEEAKGTFSAQAIVDEPEKVLSQTGLVKNPKSFLKDGWGKNFEITLDENEAIKIESKALIAYATKKNILDTYFDDIENR